MNSINSEHYIQSLVNLGSGTTIHTNKSSISWEDSGLNYDLASTDTKIKVDGELMDTGEKTVFAIADGQIHPIKTVSQRYTIVPPRRIFDGLQEAIGSTGKIIATGTLQKYRKWFILLQLGNPFSINGDSNISTYMSIGSNDGSLTLLGKTGGFRTACFNVYSEGLSDNGLDYKRKHTKNVDLKLSDIEQSLAIAHEQSDEHIRKLQYLSMTSATSDQVKSLYVAYLNNNKLEPASTRSLNKAEDMVALFKRGRGNHGMTLFDAWNGFTEYHTHHNSPRSEQNLYSSLVGSGNDHKERFFKAITTQFQADQMIDRGNQILALS